MTTNLRVGDKFPDFELPDHRHRRRQLSEFTRPGPLDEKLGFRAGYPLILLFYRGYYCPRDQQQMRQLVQFQAELAVNYARLVAISVEPPPVQAAFRAGLGAQWTFLSDEERRVIKQIDILDETEGEYAYPAQPYTFVLQPDLTIHQIYNGWFFVGRPTLEELRRDLRAVMASLPNYSYEAYTDPEVCRVRVPQQTWSEGAPPPGSTGRPAARGVVRWFNFEAGYGAIAPDDPQAAPEEIFFHFTAIPGEGYRTIKPGTPVVFEVVEGKNGVAAYNVQPSLDH